MEIRLVKIVTGDACELWSKRLLMRPKTIVIFMRYSW